MKKIIILLMMVSSLAFSESTIQTTENVKVIKEETCKQEFKIQDFERRGCCSWHGGVAGCSNGRIVCNDGSYSPSCTCNSSINPLG